MSVPVTLSLSERKVKRMKRNASRLLVLFLTLALLLPLLGVPSVAEETKAVSETAPAIAATAGDQIKFSEYTLSGVNCGDVTWTGATEDAVIENGVFNAEAKGVYRFDGEKAAQAILCS